MKRSGTGSTHTVCQMPVTAVYQMLRGLRTCLPRACSPSSVGSHTESTISCCFRPGAAPSHAASVMSSVNGS